MKTIPLLILLLYLPLFLKAQEQKDERYYRKFKFDFMTGFTRPLLNDINSRYIFAFEPKYVINKRWQAGARFELSYIGPYNDYEYLKSIGVSVDWFLNERRVRPFFGVAVSNFATSWLQQGTVEHSFTQPGVSWRTGLEFWHLRTSIEANIIDKNSGIVFDYLGFKFGANISFGKKKKFST